MAELLIAAVDIEGRYETGDVIGVQPTGHPWSERERTDPKFRIVVVKGLAPSRTSHLTAPLIVEDRDGEPKIGARRERGLNLARLAAGRELGATDLDAALDQRQPLLRRFVNKR